jgi:hypothetical protein
MSLIFKPEPSEVTDAVKTGLNKMHAQRAFGTPRLARIHDDRADLATPTSIPLPLQALPIYTLGLNALANGKDFAAANQTGWRYLLKHENEVIASADAVIGLGREPEFADVSEGPLVTGLDSAIQAANSEKSLENGEYEVRILMVPALYVAALWLVDTVEGHDLAIPIDPAPSQLIPNKVVTGKELLAVLQKAAIHRRQLKRS